MPLTLISFVNVLSPVPAMVRELNAGAELPPTDWAAPLSDTVPVPETNAVALLLVYMPLTVIVPVGAVNIPPLNL